MHCDVIKVMFDSKVLTHLLDEVNFLEGGFFVYYKNNILICSRLVMEASSYIVRECMNARIRNSISISWVCQKDRRHELSLKEEANINWYLDLSVNNDCFFSLYFWQIINVRLSDGLFSSFKSK